MSWFSEIFKGSIDGLVSSVGGVVDKFIETPDEKTAAKLAIQKLIQERMSEIEQTARTELQAKERIIVAEMASGDNYTKRARPTVVYFGLLIIGFNYTLVPLVSLYMGDVKIVTLDLPGEFWMAWGGIVATWSVGRSAEKRGTMNRLTSVITGSKSKLLGD